MFYQRCKYLKIEPPTPDRVDRFAKSISKTLENSFFRAVLEKIPPDSRAKIDSLLAAEHPQISLTDIKSDPINISLQALITEVSKLKALREIVHQSYIPSHLSEKYLKRLQARVSAESISETKRHPDKIRYVLVALYCHVRAREIVDSLAELLISIIHKIGVKAEGRVVKNILQNTKKIYSKNSLLYNLANAVLEKPDGIIKDVIFPIVDEQTLKDIVKEFRNSGSYQRKVNIEMRASYSHHYKRMVPEILNNLEFRSNNEIYKPVIKALKLGNSEKVFQHTCVL
jgi:hypothetical protein